MSTCLRMKPLFTEIAVQKYKYMWYAFAVRIVVRFIKQYNDNERINMSIVTHRVYNE